jgi:hypothetical protein
MIDFRPALDRAVARLSSLKEGQSVGMVVDKSQIVTGTSIFKTREEAMAAASSNYSEEDKKLSDEASAVVYKMAEDFIEQINRGFMS